MRSLPTVLFALLVLALAAVPADAAPKGKAKKAPKTFPVKPVRGPVKASVGIADQKPDVFDDARFRAMNLRIARRSVAWDALRYDWQVEDIDRWLAAARRARVTPLITFARSRVGSRRHLVPTARQIRSGFVEFRKRYPWVTEFAASNESNHFGEPTGRRPKLAVQYYKAMRSACPRCRIAAATLVDYPNMVSWTRAFVKAAKEQPRYWALHNYTGVNRFDLTRTRQLLRTVRGEVWLTEVGGMVANRTPNRKGKAKLKQGTQHQARVARFIFDRVARLSPRITRIYLYHWNSSSGTDTWDSALVDHRGRARPALPIVRQKVNQVTRAQGQGTPKVKTPKRR
jgi:hypothetical protein